MADVRNYTIQFRKDTGQQWDTWNPTLGNGEPGYDTTTNRFKVGNGRTAWRDLPFQAGSAYQIAQDKGFTGTEQEWLASLKGRDGANILPTDDAVAQAISTGTETGQALATEFIETTGSTITASIRRFPEIDPTGVRDSTVPLRAALSATPNGGTLVIPPGKYTLSGSLTVTEKTITIQAYGATFTQNTNDESVFRGIGGYEYIRNISNISTRVYTEQSNAVVTDLTVSPTVPWVRGDIVKIISDDILEGARVATDGYMRRTGQYATVVMVSGNVITIAGQLRDTYLENPRVMRLKNYSVKIHGGTYIGTTAGVIGLSTLQMPEVKDATIEYVKAEGINVTGCYGYRITDVRANYLENQPTLKQYGYGVLDVSSEYGVITRLHAQRMRHAFTTGVTGVLPNSDRYRLHGRNFGTKIISSTSLNGTSSGWDTHAGAEAIEFINCTTSSGYAGIGLRGRRCIIRGMTITGCTVGMNIFSDEENTESWGHIVEGVVIENPRPVSGSFGYGIRIQSNLHPSSSTYGELETRPTYLRGIVLRGSAPGSLNTLLEVTNATVDVKDFVVEMPTSVLGNTRNIVASNSNVSLSDVVLDYNKNVTGTSISIFRVEDNVKLEVNNMKLHYLPSFIERLSRVFNADSLGKTYTIRVNNLEIGDYPGIAKISWSFSGEGHSVQFKTKDGYGSQEVILNNATLESPGEVSRISIYGDPKIHVRATANATARTLAKLLPATHRYQEIEIHSLGNANLTVKHGVESYGTSLKDSTDRVLPRGASLRLLWDGDKWVEPYSI